MPRVAVPITTITRTGVEPPAEVAGDPVNQHTVANDGQTWLEVRNAAAATARTLTVRITHRPDGQSVTPRSYPVPQTASRLIGPFPQGVYGAQLEVDVDHADLKLRAYRLG
jgi:hypothetical protein